MAWIVWPFHSVPLCSQPSLSTHPARFSGSGANGRSSSSNMMMSPMTWLPSATQMNDEANRTSSL